MKITRQNPHKLFLGAVVLFGILIVSACSTTPEDQTYYNDKVYRPPQQPVQRRQPQQYYNPAPQQYYQPYVAPAPVYYPPVVPRSRYYSNPYAIPSYGTYDSDYYYSAPNYANPYDEQQRERDEAREKSAGVADEK